MKVFVRFFTLFISLLLLFSFSVSAVTQSHIPDFQARVSKADEETIVAPFTEEEIQTMKKNYALSRLCLQILEYLQKEDNAISQEFAGVYIDETGDLVVAFTKNAKSNAEELMRVFQYDDLKYKEAVFTYAELRAAKTKIDEILSNLYKDLENKDISSPETEALLKNFVCAALNEKNNGIIIKIKAEDFADLQKKAALFAKLVDVPPVLIFETSEDLFTNQPETRI